MISIYFSLLYSGIILNILLSFGIMYFLSFVSYHQKNLFAYIRPIIYILLLTVTKAFIVILLIVQVFKVSIIFTVYIVVPLFLYLVLTFLMLMILFGKSIMVIVVVITVCSALPL